MYNENHPHELVATPNANHHRKNIIGGFLILIVSLSMVVVILKPEIAISFKQATLSQGLLDGIIVLGGLFLVGFLIAFPVFLIIQGIIFYQESRELDRIGVLIKGSIAEKWVEESDSSTPVYFVRYRYLLEIYALQIVNKDVFQKLKCDQSIDVLHLKHIPNVSRLYLDF